MISVVAVVRIDRVYVDIFVCRDQATRRPDRSSSGGVFSSSQSSIGGGDITRADHQTIIVAAENDVGHTAYRIGTIESRCTIWNDLDTVDGHDWDVHEDNGLKLAKVGKPLAHGKIGRRTGRERMGKER